MSWPAIADMQGLTWFAAGRILNGVAEGTALAVAAWMLLRVVRRPNASTRFAVWFGVLLAIAALPFFGALLVNGAPAGSARSPSLITLPASWATCGLAVWAALASVGLARVGLGFRELRRLRRDCMPVNLARLDPSLQQTLVREFRCSRLVRLCTSERVKIPTAIGFFHPTVIVPAWTLRELSADELHSVVLHELAHLRRWDDWTTLVQELLRALFCIHPVVWWIAGRLSLEREMACDDQVVAQTANPRAYAQCLVSLAEKSFLRRGVALAQAAVSRMRHTSLRVAQILDCNRPSATRVWRPALALVGVFLAVCVITLGRTPQLVAFSTEAPTVRMLTAAGAATATVRTASETGREAASAGSDAVVVPALWNSATAIRRPRAAPLHRAATTHRHEEQRHLASSQRPVLATTVFVVDFRPEVVVFVVESNGSATLGSEVWRVDFYELRVFSPAGNAARQPIFAKT
jgi:beta-lactamase regulating signal transducer with metallopeptidase domain